MQKLANSNPPRSLKYKSQLKRTMGHGSDRLPWGYTRSKPPNLQFEISFATKIPFKEGCEKSESARASSERSLTGPSKKDFPSWWKLHAEAIPKSSPSGEVGKCNLVMIITWQTVYRNSTNIQSPLSGYQMQKRHHTSPLLKSWSGI